MKRRAAVIGLGHQALEDHLPGLLASNRAKLVAVCDNDFLDQIGTPFLIDGQYTFHTDDPGAGWRGDVSQAGGGCIIDMGYHIVDLLLWYFGMPNRIIYGALLPVQHFPGQRAHPRAAVSGLTRPQHVDPGSWPLGGGVQTRAVVRASAHLLLPAVVRRRSG
ncbi:Gfo/Idh/MocA family protein [Kitasatospora sp. NPDC001574]